MLKRLFLSIIILSALNSEGGILYAADLFDYCLVNFAHLDMVQDSRNAISSFDAHKLNSLDKKGTPVAFFKLISQDTINLKDPNRKRHLDFLWISPFAIISTIFIVSFLCLNNQISNITTRALFFFADSSPPVCC